MNDKQLDHIKDQRTTNVHTTDQANKRLKKRYAKEARFKALGLGAVLLSGSFLIVLLGTILWDAAPVLNQHYLTIDVPLKDQDIDPEGKRTTQSVSGANYGGMVKKWLREQFPDVSGRKQKKALYGLVSSNAGASLQQEVMANPQLVGTTHKTQILLSDYADLYFKGALGAQEQIKTHGIASPIGMSGQVRILSSANDFKNLLQEIKQGLKRQVTALQKQISGQNRLLAKLQLEVNRLSIALPESGGYLKKQLQTQKEQLATDIASVQATVSRLTSRAEALEKRVTAIDQPENLGRDIASYVIFLNDGAIKVKNVSTTQIVGEAIIPLTSEKEIQKGKWHIVKITPPESERKLSDKEIIWLDKLKQDGRVSKQFNTQFFTHGASREAEVAGIWGAVVGTFFTMMVTLALSFPIGVGAAIYLEEFAPQNKFTDLIEVNINNLAAVPSIVFGLLGLAVFLNLFGMPRSAPIVGGMVLALMTLPTIIIASRAALKAVPPSIKEAALGLGASQMQAVFHHSLPLAMPGILTGSIIGMAQALGETAPLLMIGMVAFIVDIPGAAGFAQGFTDPATVLPVQIYMWADFPEQLFQQKTAAAIVVLLLFLVAMNAMAVILRKRFERRW